MLDTRPALGTAVQNAVTSAVGPPIRVVPVSIADNAVAAVTVRARPFKEMAAKITIRCCQIQEDLTDPSSPRARKWAQESGQM